jgi:hypothetical protein
MAGAEAATIIMPEGSTVWMKMNSSSLPLHGGGCWDGVTGGTDDCIASNQKGPNPPNGIPTSTFGSGDGRVTTSAEVLPDRIRGFLAGRSSQLAISFEDTYTIHGALADPLNITVQLNATGSMHGRDSGVDGPFRYFLAGTTVTAEIGTFNPDSTNDINEQSRVTAFPVAGTSDSVFSPTQAASSPFSVPFDITASYLLADLLVGDDFTLAFGVTLFASVGVIDMLSTGHISFVLPDGVYLTSALGGEFGVQANAVPLPAALPLFAGGLGMIALLARRRKYKVAAA